ncbi:MAG: hypothetical protein V3W04_04880 [Gammaproteobacteria bacterium]
MKDVTLIENVVPEIYHKELQSLLTAPNFPWNFSEDISMQDGDPPFKQDTNIVPSCGFSHALCADGKHSTYWTTIRPLLYFMIDKVKYSKFNRPFEIFRAKANLQTQINGSTENNYNMPHVDFAHNARQGTNWIFLYYVTESDGDTFLFNENGDQGCPEKLTLRQRVTPKANTGILFKDNILHASSNPIKYQKRINLNFNIITS